MTGIVMAETRTRNFFCMIWLDDRRSNTNQSEKAYQFLMAIHSLKSIHCSPIAWKVWSFWYLNYYPNDCTILFGIQSINKCDDSHSARASLNKVCIFSHVIYSGRERCRPVRGEITYAKGPILAGTMLTSKILLLLMLLSILNIQIWILWQQSR